MRIGLLCLSFAVAAALTGLSSAGTAAPQTPTLTPWYTNYATVARGATITSPSQLHGGFEIEGIIGGKNFPQGRGSIGCVFSDKIVQREEFTIDLGQTRKLGLVIFEFELPRRTPTRLSIAISNESAEGPWQKILDTDTVYYVHTVGLDNEVPARWIHVDLGENTDGIGSRVTRLKVFPRYHIQPAAELMPKLSKNIRRDTPGLERMWAAVDKKRWNDACDALIAYYAPEGRKMAEEMRKPGTKPSERAQWWMENRVEDGGFTYQFASSDWNWQALKPGAPIPNLGFLPGAYSIFNDLANACLTTGDKRYVTKTAELLTDWLQDNPYPGWDEDEDGNLIDAWSGLKASGRCSVFSKMVPILCADETGGFSRDLKINLINSVQQHLRHLHMIRSHLGGNWLTNVNGSLFNVSLDHPEFTEQKQWAQDSLSSFETSLMRDVFPCGREVEDSTQYVPIASGQMLGQYARVRESGLKLSPEAERRMSLLWDAIAWMHYPNGSCPAIGDCFRLSPLRIEKQCVPEKYLRLYDRPDFEYMNSQGTNGKPPAETAREFAGWYVMKSPWGETPYEDQRHMFFKCSQNRTHSHRDQLQITLYAYGRELLTDPAMVGYGLPANKHFSSTAFHNTVCVNGEDQDEKEGQQHAWVTASGADFADASFHCGTVILRRQVLFVKSGGGLPDYWLVSDRLNGRGVEHTFDANFHLAEGAAPVVAGRSVHTTYADGGNLLIYGAGDSPEPTLEDYPIADRLRGDVPAKCVRFRAKTTPPGVFDTFLVPYKGTAVPEFAAEEMKPDEPGGKTACAFTVRTGAGTDVVIVCSDPGRKISFGGRRLTTDAQAVVLRLAQDGSLLRAFQYGGTSTSYAGREVISLEEGKAFAEVQGK